MAYLASPFETKLVLSRHGFTFKKNYGQNFLIDSNVLQMIIDESGITADSCVLEIGPGIGTLTQYLCENAGKVIAVEIDDRLIPILAETLCEYDNVRVINQDVLKVNINELVADENNGRSIKVVANLPYYITTPIIMELLEGNLPIESITVMVQKEVADRMKTGPGSKDYGALSLAVQYYAKPQTVGEVPPSCFMPQPGVSSSVIRLDIYDEKPCKVRDEALMFRIIRAAFNQRRKTLVNALSNGMGWGLTKEQVQRGICEAGFLETIRGEALTLEEFAALSDVFTEYLLEK